MREPLRLKELNRAVSLRLDNDVHERTRSRSAEQALRDPVIADFVSKLTAAGLQHDVLVSCGLIIIHAPIDAVRAVLEPPIVETPEPR